ncbi:MAG: FAD/NAD(P)-binding protein [Streptosporangiaceae bacterium]
MSRTDPARTDPARTDPARTNPARTDAARAGAAPGAGAAEPMLPVPYRVARRARETHDSVTLSLEPAGPPLPPFQPGQFTMLAVPGIGEVAISVSGDPAARDGRLVHTVRAVGAVTRALCAAPPGRVIGVRGPFGTTWDLPSAAGRDLIFVAGGVGLAPLRPALLGALATRRSYRRVCLVAGARQPAEFLFRGELAAWSGRKDLEVELTIDQPATGWDGQVGFVTEPLARLHLDTGRSTAFLCGPEPMIRFSAQVLLRRGVPATDIRVSLERNMKCGVGLCGHCQLGPILVCRDGPVVGYPLAGPLLAVREL